MRQINASALVEKHLLAAIASTSKQPHVAFEPPPLPFTPRSREPMFVLPLSWRKPVGLRVSRSDLSCACLRVVSVPCSESEADDMKEVSNINRCADFFRGPL